MQTTLNKIREHRPCKEGWSKLLRSLKKDKADDEPVSILQVLDSNGLEDALWCLRAVEGHDREKRLLAVNYARQAQHLITDPRSLDVLDVSEKFANGEATREELAAAREAAWVVAGPAAEAAARYAAWAGADAAAWVAARDAAWAAARAAAVAAAGDAARAAAGDAARAAVGYAAGASAWGVARYAAWASQATELTRVCQCIEQGIDPYPKLQSK
jgi:hypothetical protein